MISLQWSYLKNLITVSALPYKYFDFGDGNYYIFAVDMPFQYQCVIVKDGGTDQTDFEANFKNSSNTTLSQFDSDGANIVRIKAAKRGWSFWSIPIEVVTSTLGASLFCQDSLGNSISWISAKIYDGSDVEITTAGLLNANLNTCVKTVIDIEPTFNFEIIGGSLRINSNPTQDVRLWIVAAPDIPANLGGSKEFASGINMKFLSADNSWDIDGRVSKSVTYDPVYHSGKIRLIIKHPAGLQVNVMFIAQIYRQ